MIRKTRIPAWMGVLALAAGTCSLGGASAAPAAGPLVVTILETINHGTAVVLRTPGNRTYVIDTGGAGTGYDNGRDKIAPFLAARGVTAIDGIVISHSHNDHTGGTHWLLNNRPVKQFIDNGYDGRGMTDTYRATRRLAIDRGAAHVVAHAGDTLDWGPELTVEVLSPPKEFLMQGSDPATTSEHAVLNNNSLTLRVQYGAHVFIFPGDAYGTESNYMVTHFPDKVRATVLVAPHHGFNSTPGYAKLVKPEVVVASCLAYYEGQVASPADKTDLVYKPVGSTVYASTWNGDVEVVSNGTTYTVGTQRTKTLEVRLSSPVFSVNENGGQATVVVSRTGGAAGAVSVNYATSNGTAAAGSDYTARTGTITWADGDVASKTITVPVTDDAVSEGDETFTVALSAPTGGAALGIPSSAVVTIVNNDGTTSPGTLQFSAPGYSVNEGGQATLLVTRAKGSLGAVNVSFAATGGSATVGTDCALQAGTLSWASGDVSPKTLLVSTTSDAAAEGNETLNLTLSNPTGGATLGAPSTVPLTIVDSGGTSSPGSLRFSAAAYSANEGTQATISVTRVGGSAGAVSVSYATTNAAAVAGTDFTVSSGVLTWAAGDTAPKTFPVPTTNDTLVEGSETLNLVLSAPTGGATLATPSSAVLTIVDDDLPLVTIAATDSAAAEAGANPGTITFTRTGPTGSALSVGFAIGGIATVGGDYAISATSPVVIPAGSASATVTVTPIDDTFVEGLETASLTLSAGAGYVLGGSTSATVNITDNDVAADADGDGLNDAWEVAHFTNTASQDGNGDPDGDGVTNLDEFLNGTDPMDSMDPAPLPPGGDDGGGCGLTGLEGLLVLAVLAGPLRFSAARRIGGVRSVR